MVSSNFIVSACPLNCCKNVSKFDKVLFPFGQCVEFSIIALYLLCFSN
jgi:hypothetical protein